jgi:two-component system, LytTR family, sensor kinase
MALFKNKWTRFVIFQLRDIAIAFGISIIITYFFVGNRLFSSLGTVFQSCFYGFVISITVWKGNEIAGSFVQKRFPWEKKPKQTLTINIITAIVCSSLIIFLVNVLFYKFYYKVHLSSQASQLLFQMVFELGISIFITTLFYFKAFFVFWRKAVISGEKYKQEALSLQYETLKSYVNPHFLFNSLSVLSSLVEKDTVKSQLFIKQLSDIYRYVLEQKDKELVSLETELDFAKSFIELHKIRHGENLKVEVRVEDKSGYIIPLSMQILLENAFKHNIISEDDPLEVTVWRDNDYVIVQNKLQARKTITEAGGIGLETITRRYAFFTPKPLTVSNNNDFFIVRIPILDLSDLPGDK